MTTDNPLAAALAELIDACTGIEGVARAPRTADLVNARKALATSEAAAPAGGTEQLSAAMTFLRKRLVGTPPNVDMEDFYWASLLDEAEQVGRSAPAREVDWLLDRIDDLPRITDNDGGEYIAWSAVRSLIVAAGLAALAGTTGEAAE